MVSTDTSKVQSPSAFPQAAECRVPSHGGAVGMREWGRARGAGEQRGSESLLTPPGLELRFPQHFAKRTAPSSGFCGTGLRFPAGHAGSAARSAPRFAAPGKWGWGEPGEVGPGPELGVGFGIIARSDLPRAARLRASVSPQRGDREERCGTTAPSVGWEEPAAPDGNAELSPQGKTPAFIEM